MYPGWNYKVSWVTNSKVQPNVFIACQGPDCGGHIIFNREEIIVAKTAGSNTSTPCHYCGWHPSYPPEPWEAYPPPETL